MQKVLPVVVMKGPLFCVFHLQSNLNSTVFVIAVLPQFSLQVLKDPPYSI